MAGTNVRISGETTKLVKIAQGIIMSETGAQTTYNDTIELAVTAFLADPPEQMSPEDIFRREGGLDEPEATNARISVRTNRDIIRAQGLVQLRTGHSITKGAIVWWAVERWVDDSPIPSGAVIED